MPRALKELVLLSVYLYYALYYLLIVFDSVSPVFDYVTI